MWLFALFSSKYCIFSSLMYRKLKRMKDELKLEAIEANLQLSSSANSSSIHASN